MSTAPTLTFVDAVRLGFTRWREFSGRSTKPEFWWWFLFTLILGAIAGTVDLFLFPVSTTTIDPTTLSATELQSQYFELLRASIFSTGGIIDILLFIPTLALTVRRFRDAGAPAYFAWATTFIPLASVIPLGMLPTLTTPNSGANLTVVMIAIFAILLLNITSFVMWLTLALRRSVA